MPYGNNYGSARSLFVQRSAYNRRFTSRIPEYIDFNNMRYFYGRVDENFDPIVVLPAHLKSVNSDTGTPVHALNFVVDAFEDMKRYIAEAITRTHGNRYNGTIIHQMKAERGWVSAPALYREHMVNTHRTFIVGYLIEALKNPPIRNMGEYVEAFMRFYEGLGYPYPLTQSNFTLSGYLSPNSSGLCLEIDAAEHSADQYKVDKYYDSPVFEDYVAIARRFGFVIDKNSPWRLVANIASPVMKNYMAAYGVTSRHQFFQHYYELVVPYDIEVLKRYFISQYNDYVADYPTSTTTKTIQCASGPKLITQKITRLPVYYFPDDEEDAESFQTKTKAVTDSFWLKKYYVMRHKEAGIIQPPVTTEGGIKRSLTIEKTVDILAAVSYIANKTKTTYRKYTLPPPAEKSLFGVTCCIPVQPTEPPTVEDGPWRLAPVQDGLTPRITPATTGPRPSMTPSEAMETMVDDGGSY